MKLRATAIAVTGALMLMSGAALAQGGLEAQSEETVFFRGWQYKTDIVQNNVDRYNAEQSGQVDYATVTGDYPALMEQNLMAGAELDVLYANPSQAGRYFDGGWIMPAETLPNIDAIKADMYPNILEAWSYKGQLLGLSYFVSTRGVMHVNLKKYYELATATPISRRTGMSFTTSSTRFATRASTNPCCRIGSTSGTAFPGASTSR